MSTLKTDTLSNVAGTKTVPVATVVDGSAKAWVRFVSAGAVSIDFQFNVSSVTDNGVGDYTVNFTNAISGYEVVFGGRPNAGEVYLGQENQDNIFRTTMGVRIYTLHLSNTTRDYPINTVVIFGSA